MKNIYRVVSFWVDGWKQVEGFYDTLEDAEQAIKQYETNKASDYIKCQVFKDF